MNANALREIGWQTFFEVQVSPDEMDQQTIARVCAHHGSHVVCISISGEISVPTSIIEPTTGPVAVGDWLLLHPGDKRAERRLDRKSILSRKQNEATEQRLAELRSAATITIAPRVQDMLNKEK